MLTKSKPIAYYTDSIELHTRQGNKNAIQSASIVSSAWGIVLPFDERNKRKKLRARIFTQTRRDGKQRSKVAKNQNNAARVKENEREGRKNRALCRAARSWKPIKARRGSFASGFAERVYTFFPKTNPRRKSGSRASGKEGICKGKAASVSARVVLYTPRERERTSARACGSPFDRRDPLYLVFRWPFDRAHMAVTAKVLARANDFSNSMRLPRMCVCERVRAHRAKRSCGVCYKEALITEL